MNIYSACVCEYIYGGNTFFEYVSGDDLDTKILMENTYVEGANIDQYVAYSNFKSDYMPEFKACKNAIKNRNKGKAKSHLKKCQKLIDDLKKEIRSIDEYSDVTSMVLGQIAHNLATYAKAIAVSIATLGVGTIIYVPYKYIKMIISICKSVESSKDKKGKYHITPKDFNTWRTGILQNVEKHEKALKCLEQGISNMD